VKYVEELGISELTREQIEELCSIAEETARKYVLSKIPKKRIETLNISVEAEGAKPVTLTVDADITLSLEMKDYNVKRLIDEATKEAFTAAEKYLRALKCRSKM
jgi:hypothetical protein